MTLWSVLLLQVSDICGERGMVWEGGGGGGSKDRGGWAIGGDVGARARH